MSNSLTALLREIRACRACEERLPHGPRPVLSATTSAKILIVGQAPGTRVHETGIPWNDPSGDRLREWMSVDANLFYDEQKVAILPMGFCYPGKGKSGDLPPLPLCAKLWRDKLHQHLPNVRLTLLIGQYAQRYYLTPKEPTKGGAGFSSVTDTVSCWQQYLPDFFPLPHPSPRNNIWLRKNPWFEAEVLPSLKNHVALALS